MKCPKLLRINKAHLSYKAAYFFLFAGNGNLYPYAGVYMKEMHISLEEASILLGLIPLIAAIGQPVIGMLADKLRMHRTVYNLCCILSGIFYACVLLIGPRSERIDPNPNIYAGTLDCGNSLPLLQYCCGLPEGGSMICQVACPINQTELSNVSQNASQESDPVITSGNSLELSLNLSSLFQQHIANNSSGFKIHNGFHGQASHCKSLELGPLPNTSAFAGDEMACSQYADLVCLSDCLQHDNNESYYNQCNNSLANTKPSKYDSVFWKLLSLFSLATSVSYARMSLLDGMTYEFLGENRAIWGRIRMWGSIGYGLSAVLSSVMATFYETYKFAFVLYAIMMCPAIITTFFFKEVSDHLKPSNVKPLKGMLTVLKRADVLLLCLVVFTVGFCYGPIVTFLYWYLETLGAVQIIFGLSIATTRTAETVMFFASSYLIQRIGGVSCLYIGLLATGLRLVSYSFLVNPWLTLLPDTLHGLMYGLSYAAATFEVSKSTPDGLHGSVQGIMSSLFVSLGRACGKLSSGPIAEALTFAWMFKTYAIIVVSVLLLYLVSQECWFKKTTLPTLPTIDTEVPEEMDPEIKTISKSVDRAEKDASCNNDNEKAKENCIVG